MFIDTTYVCLCQILIAAHRIFIVSCRIFHCGALAPEHAGFSICRLFVAHGLSCSEAYGILVL